MKKGQIWVETIIYTLIGIALIGVVLAIVTPRINESRDRTLIEQSIGSMIEFNSKINEVLERVPGNKRIIEFKVGRGEFLIDSQNDALIFMIDDLNSLYSEPGVVIQNGAIDIVSTEGQNKHSVSLMLNYDNTEVDLQYENDDEVIKFTSSATPYRFSIENLGDVNGNGITVLNIEEITGG